MSEIEQAVQTALHGQLIQMGVSPKAIARLAPRAVIARRGKDFMIGSLCWRDGSGEEVAGPEIEVSLSRALGEEQLVADFVRGLIDTCTIPPARPASVVPLKTRKAAGTEPLSSPAPGFLVGASSPGLAHLYRLLSAHPAICGGAESHFFTLFRETFALAERMGQHDSHPAGPLPYCGREAFAQSLRRLWSEIFAGFHAAHPAARLHLDRVALQGQVLADLHGLFPHAPVVVILRESRREGAADLATAQAFLRACPGQPVLLVRAADLRADSSAVLMQVLAHLLPPDLPRSLPPPLKALLGASDGQEGEAPGARLRRGWAGKLLRWRAGRKKNAAVG